MHISTDGDLAVAIPSANLPTDRGRPAMTQRTCWFLVVKVNEQWWVDCEGKGYGPFETRDEAAEGAQRLAAIFGDETRQAQVWAPDDEGRMHIAWQGPNPGLAS